jgi:peptidoglycan/xylan/chitin deacetylase (PgdA/CDA1 family)
MLHRFSVPDFEIDGHPPQTLRAILAELRRRRFDLISLQELFRKLRDGEPLHRAVVFTMDDGYFDQGRVGAPVFSEFDCPATIFPVSGFLDGKIWLWWDQVSYIFAQTRRTALTARLARYEIRYRLDSVLDRRRNATDLSLRCQDALETDRQACVADFGREADVELPAAPPPMFAPLTWDEARQLEKRGITFGPHSVTHPVLSSTTIDHVASEIAESWGRLRAELQEPVPVFSYPHGRRRDYGDREIAVVASLGLWGGVSAHFDGFRPREYRYPPAIYSVPRFGLQDNLLDVLQCVSGLEAVKMRLRGGER